MTHFAAYLNHTLMVIGNVDTGTTDGGGNPVYTTTTRGSVLGRVDPKVRPDEINGPDLNPVISEYLAITALPDGFSITERDTLTDGADTYEVVGIAQLDGRSVAHHLELDLRKITP